MSTDRKKVSEALVIISLVHGLPSRSGLDVAKIISSFFHETNVIVSPIITFENVLGAIWCYLWREISLINKILRCRGKMKLIVIYQNIWVFSCFMAKLIGAKVLVYVGGSFKANVFNQKWFLRVILTTLFNIQLKLADVIVVPTEYLMNLPEFYIYRRKMRVAHTYFIENQNFRKSDLDKENIKVRTLIGYIGRFESVKGVEIIPEIINFIVRSNKVNNLRWILVGDGTLRKKIEDTIRELGLCEFVKIIGWVDNPETYLTKMLLLLLPSLSEGLPNIVLEAMACGTPVLATPVGGLPNIIKDGETGFLLTSNDPKYIADRIIELLKKPELLEKVSRNAYNYVIESFSYEKACEAWQKILYELELYRQIDDIV